MSVERRVGRIALYYLLTVFALVASPIGSGRQLIGASASTAHAAGTTEVIVHYHRFGGDYAGWNLWMWPHMPSAQAGAAYNFTGKDAYGMLADVMLPGDNTDV